jgi:hypothetical protein
MTSHYGNERNKIKFMSKIIPSLPAQGKTTTLNLAGSTPVGGRNVGGVPVMSGWNSHDSIAASGQQNAVPAETIPNHLRQGLPGQPLPMPATAVPGEAGWNQPQPQNPLVVAGRDAGILRESAPAGEKKS